MATHPESSPKRDQKRDDGADLPRDFVADPVGRFLVYDGTRFLEPAAPARHTETTSSALNAAGSSGTPSRRASAMTSRQVAAVVSYLATSSIVCRASVGAMTVPTPSTIPAGLLAAYSRRKARAPGVEGGSSPGPYVRGVEGV